MKPFPICRDFALNLYAICSYFRGFSATIAAGALSAQYSDAHDGRLPKQNTQKHGLARTVASEPPVNISISVVFCIYLLSFIKAFYGSCFLVGKIVRVFYEAQSAASGLDIFVPTRPLAYGLKMQGAG